MNPAHYSQLFSFIWNIANDVLVNVFNKGDYKRIILPFMVLRRLDLLLEPTHEKVRKTYDDLLKDGYTEDQIPGFLYRTSKLPFYNLASHTMKGLLVYTDDEALHQPFLDYLKGFSSDVQDIIEHFKFKQVVENLVSGKRLRSVLEKFTDGSINLGANPTKDAEGNVLLPGIDNHTMGTLFEQLLRKFNEENSVTEAGEHFTPRDYVELLADLAILPIKDSISDGTYSVYDAACGTGGILSIAKSRIETANPERHYAIDLYGQELQPETFATCKADLLLSSSDLTLHYDYQGERRPRFAQGSTLSHDQHLDMKFDFCISNPPFGTAWKDDLKALSGGSNKKEDISDPRFFHRRGYDPKQWWRFIPDVGDPQMLFLANNLSRMKDTPLGTRIVEVHNGSSLFTGNAGGGESNLRRYIIENDLLEAIIAMPEKSFYNTGIGTFIWIVTNRKEARRRGKVQLIDATQIKSPLRKNLGEKNCETTATDRARIVELLTNFEETPESRIFPNEEFGYYDIKVDRPLRLRVHPDRDLSAGKLNDKQIATCRAALAAVPPTAPLDNWDAFAAHLGKMPKTLLLKLRDLITEVDPTCHPVAGESDKSLRDTEQVPLRYPGGVDAFLRHEVLPYAPDAYVSESETKVGYELSFTKYFYQPTQLRSVSDITADLRALESETDGLLSDILDF